MRNILGSLLIILVGSIFSLILYFTLVPQPIYDYLVAKTIPVYPNLNESSYFEISKQFQPMQNTPLTKPDVWKIEAHVPFTDHPSASINFTKGDHPKKVIEYYTHVLQKQGWVIGSNSFKESQIKNPLSDYYYEVFKKTIGGRDFETSITSSERTKSVYIRIQSDPVKK